MNGKINTPRTVCKAIVAVAITAIAVAAIIGCSSLGGGSRRQSIATVIQTAYDLGGREMHLRRSRQVPRRAERGALRSKVARGCVPSAATAAAATTVAILWCYAHNLTA